MSRARWIHRAVVALGLLPLVGVTVGALTDRLGANPVEEITHVTGEFALRWLILCLAVTPLRRAFGWAGLAPYRRTFGLLSFTYACAHFTTYLALDLGLDFGFLWEDILERPYITVGFGTLLLMTPLAITSTRRWQRSLGRRWITLHRLVYVAAVGAIVHYVWLVKADLLAPLVHGAIVAALLAARFWKTRSAA